MWLTESSWPPILILLVVATVLMLVWYDRRQSRFVWIAGLMLAAAGAVHLVERQIVTDRERVTQAVYDVTSAFEQGDAEGTLDYISLGAQPLRDRVTFALGLIEEVRDMRVTDVQTEMKANDSRAKTLFRVNATIVVRAYGDLGHQPTRWDATWQKEAGEWKMIELQELDPLKGIPIDRL